MEKVARFNATGRRLSLNDARVVVLSQALVELSAGRRGEVVLSSFEEVLGNLAGVGKRLFEGQVFGARPVPHLVTAAPVQATLF